MYIKTICIPVSNQDRAKEFYTNKLGFKIKCDIPILLKSGEHRSSRWIELISQQGAVEIGLYSEGDTYAFIGKSLNFFFETDDIYSKYQELIDKNVECTDIEEKIYAHVFIFTDSEGNKISVFQTKGGF